MHSKSIGALIGYMFYKIQSLRPLYNFGIWYRHWEPFKDSLLRKLFWESWGTPGYFPSHPQNFIRVD